MTGASKDITPELSIIILIYYRVVSQLKTEFDTTLSFVFKLLHFKLKVLLIRYTFSLEFITNK